MHSPSLFYQSGGSASAPNPQLLDRQKERERGVTRRSGTTWKFLCCTSGTMIALSAITVVILIQEHEGVRFRPLVTEGLSQYIVFQQLVLFFFPCSQGSLTKSSSLYFPILYPLASARASSPSSVISLPMTAGGEE
jgi:hypothetical protein